MADIPNSDLKPIRTSATPQERFRDYLQCRGMRNTAQRETLLGKVFSEHDHFDAEQLMDRLPDRGASDYVSRPTVYRTLAEFVDAGLLRKFELDGRAVYEHDYGYPEHDHFYCTQCQELSEFQSKSLIELRDSVAREHNFQVRSHRLIISGVCESCRKSRRRVKRKVDRV